MRTFLTVVLDGGLLNGAIYAAVALGIVVIYKASRLLNLAQGAFVTVGALVGFVVVSHWHQPWWVGLLAATVACGALGGLIEWGLLRRMRHPSEFKLLIVLFGLILLIQGGVRRIAEQLSGVETTFTIDRFPGVPRSIEPLGNGAALPGQGLWVIGATAVMFVAAIATFRYTRLGRSIRAVGRDREVAEAFGIPATRLIFGAWVVGCALSGFTGCLVSPVLFLRYTSGTMLVLKALVVAVIGGLDRVEGVLVAGLALGLIEGATAGYLRADLQDTATFVALIAVLLLRPAGLLSHRVAGAGG